MRLLIQATIASPVFAMLFNGLVIVFLKVVKNIKFEIKTYFCKHLQLRDPKNDFIFNFNFDDKMKIFEQFEFRTK